MADTCKLSHTAAMILQAVHVGYLYGFSVMEQTGLPSGTVYPALRRLEREGLIGSKWEKQSLAAEALRPPRKYYKVTQAGVAALAQLSERYPLLERIVSAPAMGER